VSAFNALRAVPVIGAKAVALAEGGFPIFAASCWRRAGARTPRLTPVPADGGGHKREPDLDRLSNILKTFNELFGNIAWKDTDRVRQLITEEIPQKVAADRAYQNAKTNSDKQNARIEHVMPARRQVTVDGWF
jgi:hypothetical protein